MELIALCLCLLTAFVHGATTVNTWTADSITYYQNFTQSNTSEWSYALRINSNGPIYRNDIGHFRLHFGFTHANIDQLHGVSDCIDVNDGATDVSRILSGIILGNYPLLIGDDTPFSRFFRATIVKYHDDYNNTNLEQNDFDITVKVLRNITNFELSYSLLNCSTAHTIGIWNDSSRWTGNVVPTINDTVVIPSNAGYIQLDANVTIHNLLMHGGFILAATTSCPDGWSLDDRGFSTNKCYLQVAQLMTFAAADNFCNSGIGLGGSLDRHLIHIGDKDELALAYRLCRGNKGSNLEQRGCWIGLQDPTGLGQFDWISIAAVGAADNPYLFLDWQRGQPDNQTISNGTATPGGERCGQMIPWQEDPLLLEQGGWNDDACNNQRGFVCQAFGQTQRFQLVVTNYTSLSGGRLIGGMLVTEGSVLASQWSLARSAAMTITTATATATATGQSEQRSIGHIDMQDGAKLIIDAAAELYGDAYIGDTLGDGNDDDDDNANDEELGILGAQSVLYITNNGSLSLSSHAVLNASIAAAVIAEGSIRVGNGSSLSLLQGGDLSLAILFVPSISASLVLGGYAAKLCAFDSFSLTLTNRGAYIGEYANGNYTTEYDTTFLLEPYSGVYRLAAFDAHGNAPNVTRCITYNATEEELEAALEVLPLIQRQGGVTVRRTGDSNNYRYGFGFTYRIDMDAPRTEVFPLGSLDLSFYCYGPSCGCAQTKVPLFDETNSRVCDLGANYSLVNDEACVNPPSIAVDRVSTLSYLQTNGKGSLQYTAGSHRLPPVLHVALQAADSGVGIVAADAIDWTAMSATGLGQVIIAGTGWAGWDSAIDLFAPDWDESRGLAALNLAPPSTMSVQTFHIAGLGSVYTAGPKSNLSWQSGSWDGGIIAGRSFLSITKSLAINGTNKELRDVMTVTIEANATATWASGNISLANGASIVLEGIFSISNNNTAPFAWAMGEAEYLNDSTPFASQLLEIDPGRSWQSAYPSPDPLVFPPELRPGWYTNPRCGEQCNATNRFIIQEMGVLQALHGSAATFLLPVLIVGDNRFDLKPQANVSFASGGTFGNNVVVTLGQAALLALRGGQMLMLATCTIQGAGELQVTAGAHYLSFIIDAHITISGGTLTWPESRGTGQTITFRGGLLIENSGQLIVEPQSTTIVVNQEVYFKDQSFLQFPLLGIADQSTPFDGADFPDTSPRCTLNATDIMRWEGGTIAGKVDIIAGAGSFLYLDGETKYIESLAKVVNYGHCEWGTGDLDISNNGDFVNYGTMQMKENQAKFAANAYYKGTALPVDNGGDPFAQLYHTYDEDLGSLNSNQYVTLNGQFVSILPFGFDPSKQPGN